MARVTADGLRVRAASPQVPKDHDRIVTTLSAGDLVLVEAGPLSYLAPDRSADGRGWYQVHVGGSEATSYIDGGINGWVAEGDTGLEYLELVPFACAEAPSLKALLSWPWEGVDGEHATTAWERLACYGESQIEIEGVIEVLCPEGRVTPFTFDPAHLAAPNACLGIIEDDIGPEGEHSTSGVEMRFAPNTPLPERGDVVRVRGHFDDPAATGCTASADFHLGGIDTEYLVLHCREQLVVDELTVIGERELGPLLWER